MRINWDRVWVWLGRAFACLCVLVMFTVLTFCSGPGCAGAFVRTKPARNQIVETTTNPKTGESKTTTVTTESPSGEANGSAAASLQQKGTTAPINNPGGPSIGPSSYDNELWGRASELSVFWWATLACLVATLILLACGHTLVGLWTCFEGVLFALCIASPWFVLVLAGGNVAALYVCGRHFEGARAIIATAKKLGHWDAIKGGLHDFLEIGDNAAVKAAERAET